MFNGPARAQYRNCRRIMPDLLCCVLFALNAIERKRVVRVDSLVAGSKLGLVWSVFAYRIYEDTGNTRHRTVTDPSDWTVTNPKPCQGVFSSFFLQVGRSPWSLA